MADEHRGTASRGWRGAVIAGVALALYTVLGFAVAPWILHRQLAQRLPAALHRPVSIARVRVNPFTLSVTIDGLVVRDRDGSTPFLSWDRLFVRARLLPMVRRELTLEALTLTGLQLRVSIGPDGRLDCADLLEAPSAPPAAEPAPPPASRLVFGVDRLALERARVVFVDRSRARPFETTVGPVTFQLQHFRTRADSTSPYAFSGTTELGERFSWSGTVLVDPLRSSGELTLEDLRLPKYAPYYEQQVGFELRQGRGTVRSRYELEFGPSTPMVRLSDGEVHVRDLLISLRGAANAAIELPAVDVTGIAADVLGRTATVGHVQVRSGVVRAHRRSDGSLDLLDLVPAAPAAPRQDPAPFQWTVRRVSVSGSRVELADAVPERAVALALAPIDLELLGMSSDAAAVSQLDATLGWNGPGRLAIEGALRPHRPAADLRLKATGIDLASLDPYVPLYGGVAARLVAGRLGMDARLRVDRGSKPMAWAFEGSLSVTAMEITDAERGQELARWKDLQASGIKTASEPAGVRIESVRWLEPRLRLHVAEDGSTNLGRVLAARTQPSEPAPADPGRPPLAIAVGSVQVVRGRAELVDRSVRPPAIVPITEIDARLRSLSNQVTARSTVAAHALVGGAPLEVKGTWSPRLVNDATDLVVRSKGIDLTPLGPYFRRHVGYELDKGKIDLDLGYRVERRNLDGKNVVRVDQLTLGDETDSPVATSLPVKLALAVLTDKDGVIDLDVPVSGNIDDPSFSLGKLIWHTIGNVFVKVATAPFAVLGGLFGGGTDQPLDRVEFSPGTADLTPASEKALQSLAKALGARPALRLEVEGTTDPVHDARALRLRTLRQRARNAVKKPARDGSSSSGDVELLEQEYRSWVEASFRTVSGPIPGPVARPPESRGPASPTFEEMEARLVEGVELAPEDLPALAQQRAEAVRQRMVAAGGAIDPNRLFLVHGGDRAAREGGPRAWFTLR